MKNNTDIFNPVALRVVMARRCISTPELARALNKKGSKICRFLLGINEPSKHDLEKIAAFLKWPIGFFYNQNIEWPGWISGHSEPNHPTDQRGKP